MKKLFALFALGTLGGFGAFVQHDIDLSKTKTVYVDRKVEVKVTPSPRETEEIVNDLSQHHGVSSLLVKAIIRIESGKALRADRIRFEERWYRSLKRVPGETDEEMRLRASSFGLMQIAYFNAKRCGIKNFREALDPEANIDCGIRVLKEGLDRHKGEAPAEATRKALGEYNGDSSGQYAARVLGAVGEIVIEGGA